MSHTHGQWWRKPLILHCAVVMALALAAAGCGDDDDEGGGGELDRPQRQEGRQGRGPAARLEVVGPLGDGRPAVPQGGVRGRRRRGRDPERRGRQVHAAAAGRAGDHQRREGAAAGEPRLGLRRGDRGQRQVAGRQGHRLRPPDARHRRDGLLRLVRQREGRPAAGPGPRRLPRATRRSRAGRGAQRLADRQQRDAVQERLRLGHQPEVRGRRVDRGRRPVRARLGQPEGADDLRADAAEGRQQDRRRARGQRRPRQRGDLGDQAAQARPDPGHRPGRDARRASRTSSRATSA